MFYQWKCIIMPLACMNVSRHARSLSRRVLTSTSAAPGHVESVDVTVPSVTLSVSVTLPVFVSLRITSSVYIVQSWLLTDHWLTAVGIQLTDLSSLSTRSTYSSLERIVPRLPVTVQCTTATWESSTRFILSFTLEQIPTSSHFHLFSILIPLHWHSD